MELLIAGLIVLAALAGVTRHMLVQLGVRSRKKLANGCPTPGSACEGCAWRCHDR